MFSQIPIARSTKSFSDNLDQLKNALKECDAVVVGAGAGLSTSAGFVYEGERFRRYFADFQKQYGFSDMYSGGFYPYPSKEEFWAFWSRYIWINRYQNAPKPAYEELYRLVRDKDYFVLTTNVDHCFQKAGFDKKRLFYTQGDYGLFQCSTPCHAKTYENEDTIRAMVLSQGYRIRKEDGELLIPDQESVKKSVPTELLPVCPVCGEPLTMNLRSDDRFAEDEGWHQASERCENFLRTRTGKVLFLELGVGYNTPVIIKYPFWRMTAQNENATYACINSGGAVCPIEIEKRAILIESDLFDTLRRLRA